MHRLCGRNHGTHPGYVAAGYVSEPTAAANVSLQCLQHFKSTPQSAGGGRDADRLHTRSIGRHQLPHDVELVANVDAISAPELVYPEAIYLHNGETYFVRELDWDGKLAYVERRDTDYYTQAVLDNSV